jgi:hypothetical protein
MLKALKMMYENNYLIYHYISMYKLHHLGAKIHSTNRITSRFVINANSRHQL